MAIRNCPLSEHARSQPTSIALVLGNGEDLPYATLDARVSAVASQLVAAGLKPGDHVGLLLPNTWMHITLMWACFRCRLVAVPLSTRFPVSQVEKLMGHLRCKVLLVAEDRYNSDVTQVIAVDTFIREALAAKPVTIPVTVDVQKPATLLLSSGSTGLPKAILHRWGNHYLSALGANENIPMKPGDRYLLSLPLYHVAGVAILFRAFVAGATVVLSDKKQPIAVQLASDEITHVSMVGTQLKRLLAAKANNRYEALQAILLGGSAISESLITLAYKAGLPIHTSYGMTELASQITATPPAASLETLLTSGKLLNYRRLKLDADGEILVKGATRFLGYVSGEGLQKPFDETGWYRTGDVGRMDAAGNLVVEGRKDNMFISGGENIHPEEIERALQAHAAVIRAFVVPVPDETYGYRPVAFLDVSRDMPAPTVFETHLATRIARFMNPIAYLPLAEDVTGEMKVSRKQLTTRALAALASGS
ncbi:MAG: o-succinylbenzoate--CoA ligase [Bacteroidota bacterium]